MEYFSLNYGSLKNKNIIKTNFFFSLMFVLKKIRSVHEINIIRENTMHVNII